jgi:hypothetical protein
MVVLTPPQEAAMRRVLRAARELEDAQAELSRLFGIAKADGELEEFLAIGDRPVLRLIDGGLSAAG